MNARLSGRSRAVGWQAFVASACAIFLAFGLGGCTTSTHVSRPPRAITVGTTGSVISLDPARSNGGASFALMNQVYPFLLNSAPGTSDVSPDIARTATFTSPTEYTVVLKSGLTFANGHSLTSSDVKFSFDRMQKLGLTAEGPASQLTNLASVSTTDPLTVLFHLTTANDVTFPQILAGPAGPILDEHVFSADAITTDADIVTGGAFAGQYRISSYTANQSLHLEAFAGYRGLLGPAKTASVTLTTYADQLSLDAALNTGQIDVATDATVPTDSQRRSTNKRITVTTAPGGEMRFLVFNFKTQPFGSGTPEADAIKALAVRQAVADLIDRSAIANEVYHNAFQPLYSPVVSGLAGATTVLKAVYGDGAGAPSRAKAMTALITAKISPPVVLNLEYNTDHYGEESSAEYALIKSQLDASKLFVVNLSTTDYPHYSADRAADAYQVYQLGWVANNPDADDYLSPFFLPTMNGDGQPIYGGFLANYYRDDAVIELIKSDAVEIDPLKRRAEIQEVQSRLAADLPIIPLLESTQIVASSTAVSGVILDASSKFRYGSLKI